MNKISVLFLLLWSASIQAQLSDNIEIVSKALGYSLQYRVFVPDNVENKHLPVAYFVDGQWYIAKLHTHQTFQKLIKQQKVKPAILVFLDSRNPKKLRQNRREQQFMCRPNFVKFFTDELLPTIEDKYQTSTKRADRIIAGLSFGGLNAACFGLMANKTFGGIAMQSPAHRKHLNVIMPVYQQTPLLPLKVFHSVGTKDDNTQANRKFHQILLQRFHDMQYIEVPFNHSWDNWRPLIDDLLLFFFAS